MVTVSYDKHIKIWKIEVSELGDSNGFSLLKDVSNIHPYWIKGIKIL